VRRAVIKIAPWAFAVAVAGTLAWRRRLPFWPVLATVLIALLVNGLLATLEDDLPGGFNNPDGTSTPVYARVLSRFFAAGRWALIVALWGAAILMLVLTTRDPSDLRWLAVNIGLAGLFVAASLALLRHLKWFRLVALISILVLGCGLLR
jgi:hypothetical protein